MLPVNSIRQGSVPGTTQLRTPLQHNHDDAHNQEQCKASSGWPKNMEHLVRCRFLSSSIPNIPLAGAGADERADGGILPAAEWELQCPATLYNPMRVVGEVWLSTKKLSNDYLQ